MNVVILVKIKLFYDGIPYTHMNLRLPLKIAVPPKIADQRQWHFEPSHLSTSFVFSKFVMRGGL